MAMLDPVKLRKRAAAALTWLLLLAIAAVPRAAAALTIARRLDADESVVGLMAKHIAAGESVPFFFYGQDYGGGHVIEALLAAPFFKLFGASAWAVHLIPILFSTATILLVYIYIRRLFGGRTALAAAVLLSFSTQYLRSSLKSDGYIETIFLGVAALCLLQMLEVAYRETARRRMTIIAALMGAMLGLAMWSYDFAAIYAATALVFGLRRGLLHPVRLPVFIAGFAAGASPLIAANISGDYAHLRHLAGGGPGGPSADGVAERVISLFSKQIPAFLTPDCIHNFVYPIPWYAWCSGAALLIAVIVLAGNWRKTPAAPALVALLTLLAYLFSGYNGRSPRYLLPLEPFLSTAPALAAAFLYGARRHSANLLAALMLALLAFGLFGGAATLFSNYSIVEGNAKTNPESLVKVAHFLESNNVKCVKTTYFIKWRLLFLTDEKINAIDINAQERERPYLRYENIGCPEGAEPSYVFHKSSRYRYMFAAELNKSGLPFKVFYTSDHVTAVPIPKNKRIFKR
ncbi:MAG: glycosyltransferase family 39 protein [bacterium]